MTIDEKQELVKLLALYQHDLMKLDKENRAYKERHPDDWLLPNQGVKAQYEHARIISTKLSVELGKSIKSWWEV